MFKRKEMYSPYSLLQKKKYLHISTRHHECYHKLFALLQVYCDIALITVVDPLDLCLTPISQHCRLCFVMTDCSQRKNGNNP